jgi:glycosyltransferase involved in cell wall biosynthesis
MTPADESRPRRPRAWLLWGETMPISHPAPPSLRLERFSEWLLDLGYEPIMILPRRKDNRPGYGEALRLLAAAGGLGRRARREGPRLVIASSALHAPALRAIRAALGPEVTLVADVLGIRSIETEQTTRRAALRPLHRWVWRRLEQSLFGQVDLVLPINEQHATIVRGISERPRVIALRCGAESELLACEPADRATLGIPAEAVAVGFLGSLVCSRLEPIFAAWAELGRAGGDVPLQLVVIGDGPDLDRYRRRAAAERWLGQSVLFLGGLARPRALAALRACDIAYSDCWHDHGFPTKAFEYLALGRPVVIEGKPQMAEVLREGHDALFFHNPSELAALLLRLAREPDLRARLGAAGQQTFRSGHTLEHRRHEFAAALARVGVTSRNAGELVRAGA